MGPESQSFQGNQSGSLMNMNMPGAPIPGVSSNAATPQWQQPGMNNGMASFQDQGQPQGNVPQKQPGQIGPNPQTEGSAFPFGSGGQQRGSNMGMQTRQQDPSKQFAMVPVPHHIVAQHLGNIIQEHAMRHGMMGFPPQPPGSPAGYYGA